MRAPESAPSSILLVEDTLELAKALVRTLERAGLTVIHARTFAEARERIDDRGLRFDAAILDHRLPDGDSLELVNLLNERDPTCSALIHTGVGDPALAREYRGRGAFRYMHKPIDSMQLLTHVHATMLDSHRWRAAGQDDAVLPEPPAIVVDIEQAADRLRHVAHLSPTEREVAYWMLQGLRDAQIAKLLGRAERTAKRHVGQVLSKAGIHNRASLWSVLRTDSEHRVDFSAFIDRALAHEPTNDEDDEHEDEPVTSTIARAGPPVAPAL